ncbi:MAG: hypothetical protein ACYTGH_17790, partial [Planctomycetota bacterium]
DDEGLTIEEDAVSATEIMDDGEDSLAVVDEAGGAEQTQRQSARRGAAGREESAVAGMMIPQAPPASGLWALPMAAAIIVALMPFSTFLSISTIGMTMKNDSYLASQIEPGSPIPDPGTVVVPEHVKSISESLDSVNYWGTPKLDNDITLDEVVDRFSGFGQTVSSPVDASGDDEVEESDEDTDEEADGDEAEDAGEETEDAADEEGGEEGEAEEGEADAEADEGDGEEAEEAGEEEGAEADEDEGEGEAEEAEGDDAKAEGDDDDDGEDW